MEEAKEVIAHSYSNINQLCQFYDLGDETQGLFDVEFRHYISS